MSCGFDVPLWHTSATCPMECRKMGHNENCNRNNYNDYIAAGYPVRMKGAGKTLLPMNPRPDQA